MNVFEEVKCSCWKTRRAYSATCQFNKTQKYFLKRRRTKKLCTLVYSHLFLLHFCCLLPAILLPPFASTDAKLLSSFSSSRKETYHLQKYNEINLEDHGSSISEHRVSGILKEGKIITFKQIFENDNVLQPASLCRMR